MKMILIYLLVVMVQYKTVQTLSTSYTRNHAIEEAATFARDSLTKEYNQSLEIIKLRQATVNLAPQTLHYEMEIELRHEGNTTTILCAVTVLYQLQEKNFILHSSQCFKPQDSLNRDLELLFVRYSVKRKQKPIVTNSSSASIHCLDVQTDHCNTFEDVANFTANAISQKSGHPSELVRILEALVHFYWEKTLRYEMKLEIKGDSGNKVCEAILIGQTESNTPSVIKSNCIPFPYSSIDTVSSAIPLKTPNYVTNPLKTNCPSTTLYIGISASSKGRSILNYPNSVLLFVLFVFISIL